MSKLGLISKTKTFGCEFDNCFKFYSTADSRRQHYKRHHHGQQLKGKKYAIGMRGKVVKGHYQIMESELQIKKPSPIKQTNVIHEAKQQQQQQQQLSFEEKLLREEKKLFQMQEIQEQQISMTRSASLSNFYSENNNLQNNNLQNNNLQNNNLQNNNL
eukprot:Pgem_evm1s17524